MSTYHRTARFKIHNPSGRKRRQLQRAQRDFSKAYMELLKKLEPEADSLTELSTTELKTRTRQAAQSLCQKLPAALRDGLAEDAAMNLSSFMSLSKSDRQEAGFPRPREYPAAETDEMLRRLVAGTLDRDEEEEVKWALKRRGKVYRRSFAFCRFRDAILMKSEDGRKMWIALKMREESGQVYFPPHTKVREQGPKHYSSGYYLYPLEASRYHMHTFFREGTPRTCTIVERDGEWYVHYSFEFEAEDREPESVLGIDRGRAVTAAYSALSLEGELLETGTSSARRIRARLKALEREIDRDQRAGRRPDWSKWSRFVRHNLHAIANGIVETADRLGSLITFEDLSNITRRRKRRPYEERSNFNKGLRRSQYNRLKEYVSYKAKARGLSVVDVHPAYTSTTCFSCGHQSDENRPNRDVFSCQRCGHEDHADRNASKLIAVRGLWYLRGGKKGTGCATLPEFMRSLS